MQIFFSLTTKYGKYDDYKNNKISNYLKSPSYTYSYNDSLLESASIINNALQYPDFDTFCADYKEQHKKDISDKAIIENIYNLLKQKKVKKHQPEVNQIKQMIGTLAAESFINNSASETFDCPFPNKNLSEEKLLTIISDSPIHIIYLKALALRKEDTTIATACLCNYAFLKHAFKKLNIVDNNKIHIELIDLKNISTLGSHEILYLNLLNSRLGYRNVEAPLFKKLINSVKHDGSIFINISTEATNNYTLFDYLSEYAKTNPLWTVQKTRDLNSKTICHFLHKNLITEKPQAELLSDAETEENPDKALLIYSQVINKDKTSFAAMQAYYKAAIIHNQAKRHDVTLQLLNEGITVCQKYHPNSSILALLLSKKALYLKQSNEKIAAHKKIIEIISNIEKDLPSELEDSLILEKFFSLQHIINEMIQLDAGNNELLSYHEQLSNTITAHKKKIEEMYGVTDDLKDTFEKAYLHTALSQYTNGFVDEALNTLETESNVLKNNPNSETLLVLILIANKSYDKAATLLSKENGLDDLKNTLSYIAQKDTGLTPLNFDPLKVIDDYYALPTVEIILNLIDFDHYTLINEETTEQLLTKCVKILIKSSKELSLTQAAQILIDNKDELFQATKERDLFNRAAAHIVFLLHDKQPELSQKLYKSMSSSAKSMLSLAAFEIEKYLLLSKFSKGETLDFSNINKHTQRIKEQEDPISQTHSYYAYYFENIIANNNWEPFFKLINDIAKNISQLNVNTINPNDPATKIANKKLSSFLLVFSDLIEIPKEKLPFSTKTAIRLCAVLQNLQNLLSSINGEIAKNEPLFHGNIETLEGLIFFIRETFIVPEFLQIDENDTEILISLKKPLDCDMITFKDFFEERILKINKEVAFTEPKNPQDMTKTEFELIDGQTYELEDYLFSILEKNDTDETSQTIPLRTTKLIKLLTESCKIMEESIVKQAKQKTLPEPRQTQAKAAPKKAPEPEKTPVIQTAKTKEPVIIIDLEKEQRKTAEQARKNKDKAQYKQAANLFRQAILIAPETEYAAELNLELGNMLKTQPSPKLNPAVDAFKNALSILIKQKNSMNQVSEVYLSIAECLLLSAKKDKKQLAIDELENAITLLDNKNIFNTEIYKLYLQLISETKTPEETLGLYIKTINKTKELKDNSGLNPIILNALSLCYEKALYSAANEILENYNNFTLGETPDSNAINFYKAFFELQANDALHYHNKIQNSEIIKNENMQESFNWLKMLAHLENNNPEKASENLKATKTTVEWLSKPSNINLSVKCAEEFLYRNMAEEATLCVNFTINTISKKYGISISSVESMTRSLKQIELRDNELSALDKCLSLHNALKLRSLTPTQTDTYKNAEMLYEVIPQKVKELLIDALAKDNLNFVRPVIDALILQITNNPDPKLADSITEILTEAANLTKHISDKEQIPVSKAVVFDARLVTKFSTNLSDIQKLNFNKIFIWTDQTTKQDIVRETLLKAGIAENKFTLLSSADITTINDFSFLGEEILAFDRVLVFENKEYSLFSNAIRTALKNTVDNQVRVIYANKINQYIEFGNMLGNIEQVFAENISTPERKQLSLEAQRKISYLLMKHKAAEQISLFSENNLGSGLFRADAVEFLTELDENAKKRELISVFA